MIQTKDTEDVLRVWNHHRCVGPLNSTVWYLFPDKDVGLGEEMG